MGCRLPRQPIVNFKFLYTPIIFAIHDVTYLTVCAMKLHVCEVAYLLSS